MKKFFSTLTVALLSAIFASGIFAQAVLDNDVLKKVTDAVFEIVVDKTEDTKIEYEDELPMDRLPFSIRNDKYVPLGTGFLLKDGTFYSASHVFNLYGETLYNKFYIRDSNGKTYEIKDITSLSTRRDFISFTVPSYKISEGQGLDIEKAYELNTNVFSVGNALGEGIIIRNGILTSTTEEDKEGAWKWIRFSAAASPGNSGGPLINTEGNVIGIITMKSQNENLNYALPIEEIESGKNGVGIVYSDYYYRLPNLINKKQYAEFSQEVQLPMDYTELHNLLTQAQKDNIKATVEKMRATYAPTGSKSFDKVKGSAEFFYNSYSTGMPYTIYLSESGEWSYGSGNTKTYQLEDDGVVEYCSLMGYTVCEIEKPESISLEELVTNPKLYIEYILEAAPLYRTVANENINIVSLGDPARSETYVDYFGRTWFVNYFDIDFADSRLLSFALPMPTGIYVFYALDSRSDIASSHYLDMQFVADFAYTCYRGKLKNWKEYLALPESAIGKRPEFLSQIKLETRETETYVSIGDFDFTLPVSAFAPDEETIFTVLNSFKKKGSKVEIENRGFYLVSNPKKEGFKSIYIKKTVKPLKNATQKTQQNWEQLLNRVTPFDGNPYNHEQYTYLDTIHIPEGKTKDNTNYLYALCLELINPNRFEEMSAFAEEVIAGISENTKK